MEIKSALNHSADKLIETQLSLEKVLGPDWKQKCIFDNVEQVFTPEEYQALQQKREVSPEDATTTLEDLAVKANNIFNQNQSSYHAEVALFPDNRERLVFTGQIGNDTIYTVAKHVLPFGDSGICINAEKMGIINSDGKVFSVDGVVKSTQNSNPDDDLLLIETAGRKFSANMKASSMDSSSTMTMLPETYKEIGTLFHEIGHLKRQNYFWQNPDLESGDLIGSSEFRKILGGTHPADTDLDPYRVRQIKANEERGAWAFGISLLKEVSNEIEISCGSKEAVNEILERSEEALKTYDRVPYVLDNQKPSEPIPTFSREQKKASRQLHTELNKAGVPYSELPNFDQNTGENLANKPTELIKKVKDAA